MSRRISFGAAIVAAALVVPLGARGAESPWSRDNMENLANQYVDPGIENGEFRLTGSIGMALGQFGLTMDASLSHTWWSSCSSHSEGDCSGFQLTGFGSWEYASNGVMGSTDENGDTSYSATGVDNQIDVYGWRLGADATYWFGRFGLSGRAQRRSVSTTWTDWNTGAQATVDLGFNQLGPGVVLQFTHEKESNGQLAFYWLPLGGISGASNTSGMWAARLSAGMNMLSIALTVEMGPDPTSPATLRTGTATSFLVSTGMRFPY